ncbi:alpha-1,2-fucosyltransferase [Desulfobacula sp.]|uniref:alpha-1,2-fucosyltransferase n=1 Tax=Desulfobacula sp. TaxID=2593537 RepID=UPI00261CDDAF|nr:alpha-1,2-fucosyltransferase [Desulfobacula sp.]
MIISQVIGGLGNQMFQYAAGRAVSLQFGQPLLNDISGFAGYELHQGFELQRVFDIPIKAATQTDVRSILGWQSLPCIRRIMARSSMAAFRHRCFVVEPQLHYWPGIQNVPQDCYLSGYWQSEKYFCNVIPTLRADFTFKLPLANQNAVLAAQIAQVNAVSLHVRRGDYVKNPKTLATHGLCSLDYYRTAIEYIVDRIEHPCFFVFSDDISWVKDHLKINFPCRYIDHNRGAESYKDMHLMSLCRHHIIANSSFSWWGAWLNPHKDKIVVAPQQWFANDNNIKDRFPLEWILL